MGNFHSFSSFLKGPETPQEEFDFQSKLAEFNKDSPNDEEDDDHVLDNDE